MARRQWISCSVLHNISAGHSHFLRCTVTKILCVYLTRFEIKCLRSATSSDATSWSFDPLPFPQRRPERKPCVPRGPKFGTDSQISLNDIVVCESFSAAFTLKHRECKQVSARRHGGLLLRRSATMGVLAPPASRAPSKKADLGTWELPHTRALRVVCLERLRASKEIFQCTTIP